MSELINTPQARRSAAEVPEGAHVEYRSADRQFVLVRDTDGEVLRRVEVPDGEKKVR